MKRIAFFALLCASLAYARDQRSPQSGTLLQMDSIECGTDQKSAKSLTGEIIGTDSAHQTKDDKHPTLLPVGEKAQFHIEKDKMKLRVEDLDDKEREYIVVSMTPRVEAQTADNHK